MKKIVFDQQICGGEPRIDGTRLTCGSVVVLLRGQMGLPGFLELYPYLSAEDIFGCLDYCSNQMCLRDSPCNFCHGCSLDLRPEEPPARFISSLDEISVDLRKEKGVTFLGTEEDYQKEAKREDFWIIARSLKAKMFPAGWLGRG